MVTRIFLGGDNANAGKRFPLENVARAVHNDGINGATFIPSHGLWEGALEENWVIEVWDLSAARAEHLAARLKTEFHQYAVAHETAGVVSLV